MGRGSVEISYFFKDPRRFPWDIMNLTLPKAGPPHSYICYAISPYVPYEHRGFFRGSPAFFELKRFAELNHGVAEEIIKHCEDGLKMKLIAARIVLSFLWKVDGFKEEFQNRVDNLYHQGLISIPKECEPWSL